MTTAPEGLLAARRLLLDHLDMHPGRTVDDDLDPAEVGIVPDPAHVGGYHCGSDRVRRVDGVIRDYSVVESPRDRAGLSGFASAMDIGWFEVTSGSRRWTLHDFNRWLVDLARRGDPVTQDLREVIYTLDGTTVHRWDRLGRRSTGDASHRWHTHLSEFRDARGRRMVALVNRWLTHIGQIAGQPEDEMTPAELRTELARFFDPEQTTTGAKLTNASNIIADLARGDETTETWWPGDATGSTPMPLAPNARLRELGEQVAAVAADVATIKATPPGTVTITDDQLLRVLARVLRDGVGSA